MQIKTSELTGAALDWAVCKVARPDDLEKSPLGVWCVGYWSEDRREVAENIPRYSTDWAQCGPLIDKYRVWLSPPAECEPTGWDADVYEENGDEGRGVRKIQGCKTPLTAVCRAIVAAELGDTVDVPEELAHV